MRSNQNEQRLLSKAHRLDCCSLLLYGDETDMVRLKQVLVSDNVTHPSSTGQKRVGISKESCFCPQPSPIRTHFGLPISRFMGITAEYFQTALKTKCSPYA